MLKFLTFALLLILFIPRQMDTSIPFIIFAYAILLLPVFFKNLTIQLHQPPTLFFLAFILTAAAATFFSIDQHSSLVQLGLYISYFVIFTSIGLIFPTVTSRERFALFFLLITCLLSLIALYNTLVLHYVNREAEGVSFLWNYFGHNHLSALLIFAIPIWAYFLKTNWNTRHQPPATRLFLSLVTCYVLLALTLTFSVGSAISLGIALILTTLLLPRSRLTKKLAVVILLVILTVSSLIAIWTIPKTLGLFKNSPSSLKARIVYWQNAFDNLRQKPILGSGPDTFRIINSQSPRQVKPGSYYTHNFFLQQATDMGIFGLLTSLGLIFSILISFIKRLITQESLLHVTFLVALLASTLNSLVDFDWQLPSVFLIFWLIAGILKNKPK